MADRVNDVASNVTPDTVLEHRKALGETKRALEAAQAAHRLAVKRAKNDGVDTKALLAAMKIARSDDQDAELATLGRTARYLHYMGVEVGTQLGLVPGLEDGPSEKASAQQSEWDAGDAGYRAGRDGGKREENPHAEGTPLFVAWDRGWLNGQSSIARDMADGKEPREPKKCGRPPKARGAEANGHAEPPAAM